MCGIPGILVTGSGRVFVCNGVSESDLRKGTVVEAAKRHWLTALAVLLALFLLFMAVAIGIEDDPDTSGAERAFGVIADAVLGLSLLGGLWALRRGRVPQSLALGAHRAWSPRWPDLALDGSPSASGAHRVVVRSRQRRSRARANDPLTEQQSWRGQSTLAPRRTLPQ
jgi:MYXO-CTERM domain-containing protein